MRISSILIKKNRYKCPALALCQLGRPLFFAELGKRFQPPARHRNRRKFHERDQNKKSNLFTSQVDFISFSPSPPFPPSTGSVTLSSDGPRHVPAHSARGQYAGLISTIPTSSNTQSRLLLSFPLHTHNNSSRARAHRPPPLPRSIACAALRPIGVVSPKSSCCLFRPANKHSRFLCSLPPKVAPRPVILPSTAFHHLHLLAALNTCPHGPEKKQTTRR